MKRFLALVLSVVIMVIIFSRIDLEQFKKSVTEIELRLLVAAVLLFVPQVLLTAYRWQVMIEKRVRIGMWESVKLILACNALNILIPSRVGDLSKAYFLKREGKLEIERGTNIVIFEKYIDLASLGIVILTGIFFVREWDEATWMGMVFSLCAIGVFPVLYLIKLDRVMDYAWVERNRFLLKVRHFLVDSQAYLMDIKQNKKELAWIIFLSISLWFLHISQFYVIFLALHSEVSIFHVYRLIPLAILVGLIPLTVAGVGTRDSAIIFFFAPYEQASRMVAVGIFSSLRYFVPGILGLPFLNHYIVKEVPKT